MKTQPSEVINTGFIESNVDSGSKVVAEGCSVENSPTPIICYIYSTVLIPLDFRCVYQQVP